MELCFLTSKGVVKISKDGGYETYSVYVEQFYRGDILQKSRFQHHNENNPIFDEKEKQLLVDIALGKVVPASLISPKPIKVHFENWSVERYTKKKYRVKNAERIDQGFIWQEVVNGHLMWMSDKITTEILALIAPQMLKLKKK